MKNVTGISLIILCCMFTSCGVHRYLPPGERLYKGAKITVTKHPEVKESKKSLRKTIGLATRPQPNKFLLGSPYKVWFWYVIGEPKREKGFRAFLRKKLAEPPVLSSRINTTAAAENIQSLMQNIGYFKTTAEGDTTNTKHYTKANYRVKVEPRYSIGTISWANDSSSTILQLLKENQQEKGLLKTGASYRLSDIATERDRLDLYLKTKGYYYFHPDYLMAYADSTVGGRKVNLLLNIKSATAPEALQPYYINQITIFPNYTLSNAQLDTSKSGLTLYDNLLIKDEVKQFKSKLFGRTVTYRPDSIYDSRQQNATLNRFISLGTFKFVKNRFEPLSDSGKGNRMNVYYYLTPAKKKSLQGAIDFFSKENNFLGSQASINWRNRNAFKGAEQLAVKVYGGFEASFADSLKGNNNFRMGTEVSLKFPSYAIPFLRIKDNSFYPANTSLTLGYEWFRKQLFYTKNFFRLQYEFIRKPNVKTQYNFAPISISYLNASNVTDTFRKEAALNPALFISIFSEATLGSFFSYTHHTGFMANKNQWYINASVDVSGNLAGLITGAKTYREKSIFGIPFAQFVKFDLDLHYTRSLTSKTSLANRFQLGIGIPYNNSKLLPFNKLYTIGGASSIRGFRARSLGPGTLRPTASDQRFFQIIGGEYKLLFNTELRLPITRQLGWALFFDAGNTWAKDSLLLGKKAQLTKNFMKEIAVASGVGIRFDATVLLIRADIGIPLRKPFLPDGERWVMDKISLGNNAWRRENLILNIAIGYPF